jgi:isoaspartyl peptidase/L-asparaginase-like protein (Ntn-hydrolase superfamily)
MNMTHLGPGSGPLLLIHGGAGPIRADMTSEELVRGRMAGLRAALAAGWRILAAGGPALAAVQEAVMALEDDPLYNAGRGSVLNEAGEVELDASLMCGRTRRAGALCGARRLRHPVRAAWRLLEAGRVLGAGAAVEEWLAARGEELADPAWFVTRERQAQLADARGRGRVLLDHAGERKGGDDAGTVGAVARDLVGDLAAATSTGGMTNKPRGRIGDSPVIGAGTYADNRSLALSATGAGEAFLRAVFAHEAEARLRLGGQDLAAACAAALADVAELGGEGGCVALSADRGVLAFNSQGMYRAWADPASGRWGLAIFEEDLLEGGELRQLELTR